MLEIIIQILLLLIAIWFIRTAYFANKKEEPFTLEYFRSTEKAWKGFDSMFMAGWFVLGAIIILVLVYKLSTCGLVCGWI